MGHALFRVQAVVCMTIISCQPAGVCWKLADAFSSWTTAVQVIRTTCLQTALEFDTPRWPKQPLGAMRTIAGDIAVRKGSSTQTGDAAQESA